MSTKVEISLPRLVGGRDRIDKLIEPHKGKLRDAMVVVGARELRSGGGSAADELVMQTLVLGHADVLEVRGAPERFVELLEEAAASHDVADRLRVAALA